MNTTPADEILALWVEDELHGPELTQVEAWAAARPEWLEHREDARRVKALLRPVLPAAEEPPYADFFNARIAREIASSQEPAAAARPAAAASRRFAPAWLTWFMPAAAAAGMALCFWAGAHSRTQEATAATHPLQPPVAANAEPFLYTPESGVKAAWYSPGASGSPVIVLDGVADIPDSFEIPDTAAVEEPPSTTAGLDQ